MVKIAICQFNPIWENRNANQKRIQKKIAVAAKAHADWLVFPEMTLTGFSMNVNAIAEEPKNNQTLRFFQKMAKKYLLGILFGVVEKNQKMGKNLCFLVDKNGNLRGRYQKIHPFSIANEHKYFQAGNSISIVEYRGFKISPMICYDLRFAGLVNMLLKKRPDIVIVIGNWPQKRIEQWKILLRARALDLQAYIVGVNRLGKGGGVTYNGESTVVGPNGKVLLNLKRNSMGFIDLEKKPLHAYRNKFPFLKDNRMKLYETLQ